MRTTAWAWTILGVGLGLAACSSDDDASSTGAGGETGGSSATGGGGTGGAGGSETGGTSGSASGGTSGTGGTGGTSGTSGAAGWPSGGSAGTAGTGGAGGTAASGGTGGTAATGGAAGTSGSAGVAGTGGACTPGFVDCDGDPSNGCEIDTNTDPNHCGDCATQCPTADHAFPTCDNGTCTVTCLPTHDDCDQDLTNGCEAVLGSDLNNCGICGNVCTAGPSETPICAGGTCDVCPVIEFSIATKQACAISVLPGYQLDAEAFINVGGTDHRVLAMDQWGSGHVIAWCDSTTTYELLNAFDAVGYLGQTPNPTVASFGDTYLCTPGNGISNLPTSITYLGTDLPSGYSNNAAQLAADYDVLIFCGFRIPWANDWSDEIEAFVSVHGKGFLAAMDYEGVVQATDFQNMTQITDGAGIVFEPLNLPWAPASTSVVLDCVPGVDG